MDRMFFRRFFAQSIFTALIAVSLFASLQAFAGQVGVAPDADAPAISAKVLAWWSATALVATFVMNLTTPGTPTPWNWTPQVRFYVALLATTVGGVAHACQSGTLLQTAILTALGSLITALVAHYSSPGAMAKATETATKVGGLLLVGSIFAATTSACTKQQEVQAISVAETTLSDLQKACLGVEAALPLLGLPAATVAEADQICGIVNVADPVVQTFLDNAASAVQPAVAKAQAKITARAHGKW